MDEIKIVRNKRKSVVILFENDNLIVKCPYNIRNARIEELLKKNKLAIEKLKGKSESFKKNNLLFIKGLSIIIFGKEYGVEIEDGVRFVQFENNKIELCNTFTTNNADYVRIYAYFEDYFKKILFDYAAKIGVSIKTFCIKKSIRNWGYCDRQGRIMFNNKICILTNQAIEYLVVHELCHLKFFNHSPNFWSEVEKYCKNYKTIKAEVSKVGRLLRIL